MCTRSSVCPIRMRVTRPRSSWHRTMNSRPDMLQPLSSTPRRLAAATSKLTNDGDPSATRTSCGPCPAVDGRGSCQHTDGHGRGAYATPPDQWLSRLSHETVSVSGNETERPRMRAFPARSHRATWAPDLTDATRTASGYSHRRAVQLIGRSPVVTSSSRSVHPASDRVAASRTQSLFSASRSPMREASGTLNAEVIRRVLQPARRGEDVAADAAAWHALCVPADRPRLRRRLRTVGISDSRNGLLLRGRELRSSRPFGACRRTCSGERGEVAPS